MSGKECVRNFNLEHKDLALADARCLSRVMYLRPCGALCRRSVHGLQTLHKQIVTWMCGLAATIGPSTFPTSDALLAFDAFPDEAPIETQPWAAMVSASEHLATQARCKAEHGTVCGGSVAVDSAGVVRDQVGLAGILCSFCFLYKGLIHLEGSILVAATPRLGFRTAQA